MPKVHGWSRRRYRAEKERIETEMDKSVQEKAVVTSQSTRGEGLRDRESPATLAKGETRAARKRRQVIDAARKLFFASGFDVTSMDDVAREAGVSKATLYSYFQSKEQLFSDVVAELRHNLAKRVFTVDYDDPDVPAVLKRLAIEVARVVTTPYVVMSFRAVLGIGNRMPELGAAYYDEGPRLVIGRLAAYLEHQVERGQLTIEDPELAAAQFLDMAQTTMARPMLFGAAGQPPEERIDYVVDSAVRVFMAAYRRRHET
jgi:AcrR family transcriptional regulator